MTMGTTFKQGVAVSPALLLALGLPAVAQVAPDAGRTLQMQQVPLEPPKPSVGLKIMATPVTAPAAGGPAVRLKSFSFSGNSQISAQALGTLLADAVDTDLDMAQLWALAARVTAHYQQAGFPFARAILPPQQLQDGALRIEVIEGRYGQLVAKGSPALAAGVQNFLRPLVPGAVIEGRLLERTVLIVDDQPGVKATPVMRPGQQAGTGDLDLLVEPTPRLQGSVGLDNQGNRYTGEYQLHADGRIASPFFFGDQLKLQLMATDRRLWTARLGYGLPLGYSGMRGHAEYALTRYQLGREFSQLGASGTAKTAIAGLSYPVLRSQNLNLTLDASLAHKRLHDEESSAATSRQKHSVALPLSANFDARDAVLGGAVSYGSLVLTPGRLSLDPTLLTNDQGTAQTAGRFDKLTLELARIQALSEQSTLFGRVSAQWASKNLDSSEGFGPGGPNGVRAYPAGEAYGNEGWLVQAEWRWRVADFSPYAFYDASHTRINARPWAPVVNGRDLAGLGLGLRAQVQRLSIDASVARSVQGGEATSTKSGGRSRVWVSVAMAL